MKEQIKLTLTRPEAIAVRQALAAYQLSKQYEHGTRRPALAEVVSARRKTDNALTEGLVRVLGG